MNKTILIFLFATVHLQLTAQEWQTDFDTAQKMSQKAGNNIMLVFKGSDWCAPCIKLDKEILKTETFSQYASENLVLLEADFPRKKANRLSAEQQEKNGFLAEKYNRNGYFPFVVILDQNGKVLGQSGYEKMSPEEFVSMIAKF